jgi:hypothetical protein
MDHIIKNIANIDRKTAIKIVSRSVIHSNMENFLNYNIQPLTYLYVYRNKNSIHFFVIKYIESHIKI